VQARHGGAPHSPQPQWKNRMSFMARSCASMMLPALLVCSQGSAEAQPASATPETVVITYHVKAGAEPALERVIAEHWRVARRLRLVLPALHVVAEGGARGHRDIIEILSWRDSSIPDDAPEAISQLWAEMNALVEARDGQPGINFLRVSVLP
jgi:hypothetical protein